MSDESILAEDEGTQQSKGYALWKVMLVLIGLACFLFMSSAILCGINVECRNHIPTLHNLMNSTFSTPFVVSGMNAVLGLHFISSVSLYQLTEARTRYWSLLQVGLACCIYLSTIITLFVFPFTGWEMDWANLSIIISTMLWQSVVVLCLWRHYAVHASRRTLLKWSIACIVLYASCSLIYIVLRGVQTLSLVARDDGMMVVEIVAGLSFLLFMGFVVVHTARVRLQFVK